jgi:hypothetical protein
VLDRLPTFGSCSWWTSKMTPKVGPWKSFWPILTFLAPSFWINLPQKIVPKPETGLLGSLGSTSFIYSGQESSRTKHYLLGRILIWMFIDLDFIGLTCNSKREPIEALDHCLATQKVSFVKMIELVQIYITLPFVWRTNEARWM